jgi:regulator of RNase E activity RraA
MSEIAGMSGDTREALLTVSTATLATQLRQRGLAHCFLEGLSPARSDLRLLGTARTLRYVALREDVFAARGTGYNEQKRVIDSICPGEVLVIEARADLEAGTIGDILARRVAERGGTGIVTDGCLRDSPSFATLDVPTYSGGAHAAPLGRRHVPMDSDLPVTCGGVLVMPGDVLCGDAEGVVVVPRLLADEVASAALEEELEERFIYEQVTQGERIEGLYPLGAGKRSGFERWKQERIDERSPA